MWDTKIETWTYLNLSVLLCKRFWFIQESLTDSLKLMSFSHVCSTFFIFPNSYILLLL